ncbi:hypothetical protein DMN91_010511 [Ooceraea biroi]|uniref:Uncharacterized protein n=2 Tax=Ooceraea biroi TaxID=2015173 RepID=A0A3L8D8M3_OOCBI|nr:uncharacterized protein LOC105288203 isoform X1 [Ooceraea biroi]RLU16443.1 hypothetical protein DMN91_010511 [Ooceraea biroi]
MKCVRIKNDKKSHTNIRKDDVENMAATVNDKVNKKNDSSPQSREHPVSSTPLRKMQSTNAEESPDLDGYPSPIFPCTQEGGNEVAWDWQSSLNKTPEGRSKKQKAQFETPKGTKLLQRKRNSNSPLLYKPLKRKTIKMEHMENIGQFAAELQALNEKVRFIKQTDKNSDVLIEEKPPIVANTNSKEEVATIQGKEQDCIGKTDSHDNAGKNDASGSYDDLFDDSIDDCMARCTQEIEEKFNLITDKGATPHSQTSVKKEELPSSKSSNKPPVQSTSNDSIREPSVRNFLHKSISDNNALKTYSKLSLRRDANSSIHVPLPKEKELHKSHLNNNNMIRPYFEKSSDHTRVPKSNIELFDIPDDSFDDCLASCVEDEKLLSAPTGSDNFSSHRNDGTKYEANCKHLIQAPLKSEAKSTSSVRTAARDEASSCAFFENRKFFKTKSLSDQYIGQDTIASARSTLNASSSSCFTMRSKLHLNSTKSTTATHTGTTRGSVSNNSIVTNHDKVENSAISLTRDTGRTHGSDVNRCAVREGGDRFGRYHSTGNMRNNTKETRSGSQPSQCTAEEIEQKRLQAKMRLEAKRKLYNLKISNNIKR